MRLFNLLVFDQLVRGNTEVVSPVEFNDPLGKAFDLVFEVEVEESSGTTQTITVKYKTSNSGKAFKDVATIVSAGSPSPLPYRAIGTEIGRAHV